MNQANSTVGLRCLALAGGVVFLGGTVIQVYGDVLKGAPITEKHLLSAVIIAGAILVGHIAVESWRVNRRGSSIAFWCIFVACTGLVVLMSVGRQGENLAWTQAQADASEDARRDARVGLKRAQGMLAEAQDKLAKECASGKGKRCDGIRSTISIYEGSAAGHQATLDKLGPPKLVAPEEEQFAKLAATFLSVDKDRVKAGTIMAKPFLVSAVCEFGVILCFGFAFRGEATRQPAPEKTQEIATNEPKTAKSNSVLAAVAEASNDTDLPTDEELVTIKKRFFTETPKQVVARSMPVMKEKGLLGRNLGSLRLN